MNDRDALEEQRCPNCGDPMYADQEWRLRKGLELGVEVAEGDYVHAQCRGESDAN